MNTKTKTATKTEPADVAEQMEVLRADISTLTSLMSELAKSKGNELSQAAKDQIATAQKAAGNTAEAAKDQALQLQDQANDFVRTQPATAIGMATAFGFVIGLMLSRK